MNTHIYMYVCNTSKKQYKTKTNNNKQFKPNNNHSKTLKTIKKQLTTIENYKNNKNQYETKPIKQ